MNTVCSNDTSTTTMLFVLDECIPDPLMTVMFWIAWIGFAFESAILLSYVMYKFFKVGMSEMTHILGLAFGITVCVMLTHLGYVLHWPIIVTNITYAMYCIFGMLCISRVNLHWMVTVLKVMKKENRNVIEFLQTAFLWFNITFGLVLLILWIVAPLVYPDDSKKYNYIMASGMGWIGLCALAMCSVIVFVGRRMKLALTFGIQNQNIAKARVGSDNAPDYVSLLQRVSIYTRVQGVLWGVGSLLCILLCVLTWSLGYCPQFFYIESFAINPMMGGMAGLVLAFYVLKSDKPGSSVKYSSAVACIFGIPDVSFSESGLDGGSASASKSTQEV